MSFTQIFKSEFKDVFTKHFKKNIGTILGVFLTVFVGALTFTPKAHEFALFWFALGLIVNTGFMFFYIRDPSSALDDGWIYKDKDITFLFFSRSLVFLLTFIPYIIVITVLVNLFVFIYPEAQRAILNDLNGSALTFWMVVATYFIMLFATMLLLWGSAAYGEIKKWSSRKKVYNHSLLLFLTFLIILFGILQFKQGLYVIFSYFSLVTMLLLIFVPIFLKKKATSVYIED